ncbi:hypothetical protein SAMN06309944_0707 [Micrococcales bacterium KH10]|nr:hypothetical protein SAMN06309944_0707 [Micrococcales bacterium KH10]
MNDPNNDDELTFRATPRWGAFTDPLWGPDTPHLPYHRASAKTFGAATPWVVESGIGHRGAPVGIESGGSLFCLDPWELYRAGHITAPSMVAIGSVGSGKSSTVKTLACGLVALGRKIAVASDPKAEWVRIADVLGGDSIRIGPGRTERINPLDSGPRPPGLSDQEWHNRAMATRRSLLISIVTLLRHGQPLSALEHTALELALTRAVTTTQQPTIPDVMDALLNPDESTRQLVRDCGDPLGHALRRLVAGDLAGMFDQHSTVSIDPTKPMLVIDTSDLLSASPEVTAIASACTSTWLDSIIRARRTDFWLIITEEGWAAMRDPNAVARMDERVRLAGEWGIANMLIMHELADLDMVGDEGSPQRNQALGLLSKSQVKIVHTQSVTSIDATAKALALTRREADTVTALPQAHALWKIGRRSFIVRTRRTHAQGELFNTDERRAG